MADLIANRRRLIAAAPHKAVGSNGSTILITEPKIERMSATFAATQTGSGTPSTSNVRPIIGWSEVPVLMCGKNLYDGTTVLDGAWLNENTMEVATVSGGSSIYVPIRGGQTYTISKVSSARFTASTTTEKPAIGVKLTHAVINHTSSQAPITIETSASDRYIVAFVYRGSSDTKTKAQILASIQVEEGETATTYQAFSGIAPTASLGSTYYGGTVDLVSGAMTVTHGYVLFDGSDDEAWNKESLVTGGTNFYIKIASATGYTINTTCNMAKPREEGVQYLQGQCYISGAKNFNIAIGDIISVTTASAFKTWLSTHNVQLVYPIASQTVTLTPQTIAALRGQQSVSSPAGSVSITYWTN